jgi:uncharacterized protein YbjT (DUF2867 family)
VTSLGTMAILVTGATGNIGRKVVDHLIMLGANDIRALTVNPEKAALPDGVTAVTGYLGKPDSLPAAFEGVDCVYLAPLPDTLEVTLNLMAQAGVPYVVALSGGAHWQEHADTITASGLPNTQLGPGEFCENFVLWADQIRTSQTVREPYPDVVQAPVSMDDIARVAAKLLAAPDESHLGVMYELTGPVALTRAQIAGQIGAGIGIDVRFEQCERAEAEQALRALMGDEATWYLDMLADRACRPQPSNTLVADLTGVPAISMAQWAAANAGHFRSWTTRSALR